MKFRDVFIIKSDLISGLDSILHMLISFALVNLLVIRSSELEYSSFMNSFALMSLGLLPVNLFANNLLAELPFNDRRYLGSLRIFLKFQFFYASGVLLLMSLMVDGFFLPGLVAWAIFFINISVNILDKERRYLDKIIGTIIGLAVASLGFIFSTSIILLYAVYFLVKSVIYLIRMISLIKDFPKSKLSLNELSHYNVLFSIATGFGDNGMRYFASVLLPPVNFAFFDIVMRIFYSGRNLAGRLHYPALLQLQENESNEQRRNFTLLNILISAGFFIGLILLKYSYKKIEIFEISQMLIVALSLVLFVNLMVAYSYNELLKYKKYFHLSLCTLTLPLVALVLMLINVSIEVIIPSCVFVQSIFTIVVYKKLNL